MKKTFLLLILFYLFGCSHPSPENTDIIHSDSIPVKKDSGKPVLKISKNDTTPNIEYPTHYFDSVNLQSAATFVKSNYNGNEKVFHNEVQFTLKVKNNGSLPIPDIQGARNTSRLHIFINGDGEAMFMALANCSFQIGDNGKIKYKLIASDSSDTWAIGVPVSDAYGSTYTYQWEYMGIKSKIIKVDLKKKTCKEL